MIRPSVSSRILLSLVIGGVLCMAGCSSHEGGGEQGPTAKPATLPPKVVMPATPAPNQEPKSAPAVAPVAARIASRVGEPVKLAADPRGPLSPEPSLAVPSLALGQPPEPPPQAQPSRHVNPLRQGNTPSAISPLRDTSVGRAVVPPPDLPAAPASQAPGASQGRAETEHTLARPPFDPIKENGPIFEGWPKPKLALVITGREDGYIEPCGCAGLDRMKGGISRRHTMLQMLRKEKGWPVIAVDVGGLAKGFGPQAELKFNITVDAIKTMGYDAIGFGVEDLRRIPADDLVSVASGSSDQPSPFVSANVGLYGLAAEVTARQRVVEAGGMKVGLTAVLGKGYQKAINNPDIEIADPEKALAQIVPQLKKQCQLMILLAYATKEESDQLSRRFPEFQVVVTAGGGSEPPKHVQLVEGSGALRVEVGEKGMNAVVLGFYDGGQTHYRDQRVPLDSRFKASPDMRTLMIAYQDQLRQMGLAGLSIRPKTHWQTAVNGQFVGSKKCVTCHEISYDIWKKTPHARAWKTLLDANPPRDADPECISCHVVGWHPTEYFPYKSGFSSAKQTPQLENVGCESCHGPGSAHCKAEEGGDTALQEKLRIAVRVTKDEARKHPQKMCYLCHDLDNSPDFNFDTYWPKVEHYETTAPKKAP